MLLFRGNCYKCPQHTFTENKDLTTESLQVTSQAHPCLEGVQPLHVPAREPNQGHKLWGALD